MFHIQLARRLALVIAVLVLLASSCAAVEAPKNVILLIGDGMGIGAVTAGRVASKDGKLALDSMPYTGFVKTSSASKLVTDSAAAGTALATGHKTNNGVISQTPDGKRLTSILEVARSMGKLTGIISTKHIVDATPAVFVAHADNRAKGEEIAVQMINSRANLILGGGKRYFLPESDGGSRKDDRNLLKEAKKLGYDVCLSAEDMAKSKSDRMLGLFADYVMASERPEPTIAEMTEKAIGTLSKGRNGFFLMSEGGKIDVYGHGNNAEGIAKEMLDFDEAIGKALEFARKDGRTLVVVTADHETGGAAVLEPSKDNPKLTMGWVTKGHAANMVPVYAFGPGAENFTGTLDNTEIPKRIAALWKQRLN